MQTHPPEDQLAVVLGQRQLIAICCMFLTVLGLVATLAYVAGRSITAAQMQPIDKTTDPVRPALVVEAAGPRPMQAQAASIPKAQEAPPPLVVEATPPPVKRPAPAAVTAAAGQSAEPAKGEMFWQIGLVERGMGPVFLQYMKQLNLDARIAAGTSQSTRRVLVGPVAGQAEIARVKQALDQAGFQSFLKTY
jgi:cell division protein FtsN